MSLKYEPSSEPQDGKLFGVFDGHGGKYASTMLRTPHTPNFFFIFTLVTGPRRSLSLKLSDTRVYEPQIRVAVPGNRASVAVPRQTIRPASTLEAAQGQMDGFFSQLPYKCHQNRVASVGD